MPTINWKRPIQVRHLKGPDCTELSALKNDPGLYFFSRRYGSGGFEPFYIGRTVHVRKRLEQYLNSNGKHEQRVRNVIAGGLDEYSGVALPNGTRYFHYGYIQAGPGQRLDDILVRAEKAALQYAKIVGWALINNHHSGDSAYRHFEMNGRFRGPMPELLVAHRHL
jgi:hypothetical protein